MGGGHAGTAVGTEFARLVDAGARQPLTEVGRRPKRTVDVDQIGVRQVTGAGDVPRDRIDGLGLAPEALRCSGVEERAAPSVRCGRVRVQDRKIPRYDREVAGRARRPPGVGLGLGVVLVLGLRVGLGVGLDLDRAAGALPGAEAAVEYADVGVAGPSQRPPEPGRRHTVAEVVDDHRAARGYARRAKGGLQRRHVGKRVPAAGARRSTQLGIEINESGTGNVARPILVPAWWTTQSPPYVQYGRHRGATSCAGSGGRDDRGGQSRHVDQRGRVFHVLSLSYSPGTISAQEEPT